MNELPPLQWILLNILLLIFLFAIIFTGQVAYYDDPKTPKWVRVSCGWACPLLILLMLFVFSL